MTEIFYLIPPHKVFSSTQRVLLRNGFTLDEVSENGKQIYATKKGGFFRARHKVEINVSERNGQTLLAMESSSAQPMFRFLTPPSSSPVDKLIDQLNTHVK
jgi:hypothetical protein